MKKFTTSTVSANSPNYSNKVLEAPYLTTFLLL
nr:MAG TPA: hypothetical protein [Bacteriophage sp.]